MPDSLKRIRLRKLPLNRAIISDILLWLALALLLAYAVYYFAIALPAQRGQIIVLHFHNANEISKGSPVRMMGTDIGFVSDLKIENDYVAVTVQTYPNTLPIPSGSEFNILFTGLAGAKSVEVVPPDTPQPNVNGHPVYLVEEPIRMRDTLNASIDVTQALQKGAENITDFFGKKKPVEELQFNIHQVHQISVTASRNTKLLNQALISLRHDVRGNIQPAMSALSEVTPGMAEAARLTNPTTARPELKRFFDSLLRFSQSLQNPCNGLLNPTVLNQRLTRFNQMNTQLAEKAVRWNQKINPGTVEQKLQAISTQSNRLNATLDRAVVATSKDYQPSLKNARTKIQAFNKQIQQMDAKFSRHLKSTTSPPTP